MPEPNTTSSRTNSITMSRPIERGIKIDTQGASCSLVCIFLFYIFQHWTRGTRRLLTSTCHHDFPPKNQNSGLSEQLQPLPTHHTLHKSPSIHLFKGLKIESPASSITNIGCTKRVPDPADQLTIPL